MTIPVWVDQQNGKFVASVPGTPGLRAEGDTKDAAVAAVQTQLEAGAASGSLVLLDVNKKGLETLIGRYAENEVSRQAWEELIAEVYRYRDELKAQEFPE